MVLVLGDIVKGEREKEASEKAETNSKSIRSKSKRKDPYEAAEEYVEKHDLRDKGFD